MKLWAAKIRFGVAMTLGLVVSFAYFNRPTKRQYLESKREEFTKRADVFATLCSMDWSAETPKTEPIDPLPKLEFVFLKGSIGNVETIVCGRAIDKNWISNYLQEKQYVDLSLNTNMSSFLGHLYRSRMRDSFLTSKYKDSINAVLSAPYWLLYDPACTPRSSITLCIC